MFMERVFMRSRPRDACPFAFRVSAAGSAA